MRVTHSSGTRATVVGTVLTALVASLIVTLPPLAAQAAPSLPEGFQLRDLPTGLGPADQLTDFAFLPDQSLLSADKRGKVVWAPTGGTPRQIATLPVTMVGDLGLTGLAVAADYATSRTVYTARTAPATGAGSGQHGVLRLSKWTVQLGQDGTPTGLAGEQILVQTSADADTHGISGVVAAEDGTIWLSIGDSGDARFVDRNSLRALDVNDPHGKLLHIRPDGSGVPGNPFYDAAAPGSVRSLVYASGLRSPFRISLDAPTGRPIVGDVGWGHFEELNLVNPGNNFGWPCWEGNAPTRGYRDLPECAGTSSTSPLWTYPHLDGTACVVAGVRYTGTTYPEQYRGRYFFGDFVFGTIAMLATGDRGELVTPPEPNWFARDVGMPVKFATMPDGGDIVFAEFDSSTLKRLVYAPGNAAPVADIAIATTTDPATRTVTLDGRNSTDPNGDTLTYRWDFGDGTPPADGPAVVTHTYPASPEQFTVRLTVTDPLGASGEQTTTVFPGNHAPDLTVNPPPAGVTFAVGDTVTATAGASDAEDGPLQVSWSVTLVHCTAVAVCHEHPGEQQQGPNFSMVFTGHPGDSRIEVSAAATDSRGATSTQTFAVQPRQRRVSIQSNAPATFTIGDEQTTSGLFTVGSTLPIIAPQNAVDGVASFDRWGDGNTNRVRQLTLPDADQVLTVTYSTPIDRRYASDAALRNRIGTPVAAEQGDTTVRWREYTNGRIYWSPSTDVRFVAGAILTAYLAANGHLGGFGLPVSDETSRDNTGVFSHFQNATLYWSPQTGTFEVHGSIRERYNALGGELGNLGYPTTNETSRDNIGAFNHFQGGSIFWHPSIGPRYVVNAIRALYASYGWELSPLGYPTTDETSRDNVGTFNRFQSGSIYWSPGSGTHSVMNGIRARYDSLGAELSFLGYPTTDETSRDNVGVFNHFQWGSMFWSPAGGIHYVVNGIRARYAQLGWELSYLGYPISDEYGIPGGTRTDFQRGFITWNASNGQITDRPY